MAKQKEEIETKYMELNVPQDVLCEAAEIIEQNEIEATIVGTGDDEDSVRIGFEYEPQQRSTLMEIMELVEEYNNDEGKEEGEDD